MSNKKAKSSLIEKRTGQIISFDGTPIYYEIKGSGEPMIFIYGIACLMNHWHHQVEYFSKKYKTISFDLRGHHKSNPISNPENLKIEDLSKDIITLCDELGLSSVHFWGHSFGAPVLLKVYQLRPDLFKSIIMVNGFAKNPIKNMFGVDAIEPLYHFINDKYHSSPDLWNSLWKTAVENPISMYAAGILGGFNLKLTHFKDIEVYARGVARMELPVFLKLFGELINFDGGEILPLIKVPTLIIAGDKDNITPIDFQKNMKELIPNSEFVQVPYGSHCTQLDFPDYINLKVQDFLKGQK